MTDILSTLLSKKNHPKEFFAELHSVYLEEYQQEEKKLPALIIKIHKEDDIDFCQMAVDAINDNFSCFDVSQVFEGVLSDFKLNTNSILLLAECLFEGMQDDLMACMQFKPFEELFTKQPTFFRELISELLKQDRPYITGYVSNFYLQLSNNNEHKIHKELCALKTHKSQYVLMALASALGSIDYNPSKNRNLIKQTLNVLQELEEKKSDQIDRIIIFSYMNLLDHSEQVKKKVVHHSGNDQLLVQGAVSRVLFLAQEKHGNEPWFSDSLMNLVNVSHEQKEIIKNLDYILSGLIKKNDNWELAEKFFISWIFNSNYKSKGVKLSELFNSTFVAFVSRRERFERLLTMLFNHDDYQANWAASDMVSYCQVHRVNNLKLDKAILKSLSHPDRQYVCRKILGYVISPEYLCSLCFSVLEASPRNKLVQSLIYGIFNLHIGYIYPGRTIDFLTGVSSKTKSENQRYIADRVTRSIESDCSQRDSLPKLKELIPPRQKAQRILFEHNKKMNQAMEEAEKNSIMSMLTSKIVLKQGTGSFNYFHDQYSEISKLGSFSTEVEIPHTEISHPVDAELERMHFRLAKREPL